MINKNAYCGMMLCEIIDNNLNGGIVSFDIFLIIIITMSKCETTPFDS